MMQRRTAQEYFGEWYKYLNITELNKAVANVRLEYLTKMVYPKFHEIFRTFTECDHSQLKVVILGMDPYNDGSATGVAFANRPDTKVLSPSLQVIKDCLEENYTPQRQSFDVTLEDWEKQGVLMLNSSLTVVANQPKSHIMIWRKFISSFLEELSRWQTGLIYVLMGEQAKTFKPYIGPFNEIIECKHPAFYARTQTAMPNVFSQIDKLTWDKNKLKITWI